MTKPREETDKARAGLSAHTRRAYAADWRHFCAWCRREGQEALVADPQIVGAYITACACGTVAVGGRCTAVSTIKRRLSALIWAYAQRGSQLDRSDPHLAGVLVGMSAAPPRRKAALMPDDLHAMLEICDRGSLRGLRDRAMLLIGFAGGLRRSEIVGLDAGEAQTVDGCGWVEIRPEGLVLILRGKTAVRRVAIARGISPATCPAVALEAWLRHARIARGPLFRRIAGKGREVGMLRLNDRAVARLINRTAMAAGLRGDLPEDQRAVLFAGQSLRAGRVAAPE